jgi:hypothetical protein
MDSKVIGYENVKCIPIADGKDQWQAVVNTAVNLQAL